MDFRALIVYMRNSLPDSNWEAHATVTFRFRLNRACMILQATKSVLAPTNTDLAPGGCSQHKRSMHGW